MLNVLNELNGCKDAPAPRIRDVARRLSRLSPDWRDPERYFHNRDEIERELKRLARELEAQR